MTMSGFRYIKTSHVADKCGPGLAIVTMFSRRHATNVPLVVWSLWSKFVKGTTGPVMVWCMWFQSVYATTGPVSVHYLWV